MEQIRSAVAANLHRMQAQQQDSLAEIQTTVNEKLAQSLNQQIGQSFQLVSSRLEQVYQGLGEMQTLAVGVGDLKKVLSNVKTRGILGEVQLGAILQEILSPEQYATEIPTLPNSRNHVEFAVRMPADGEQPVWLPIDSKFPGDTYAALQDAREQGDPQQVEAARQKLLTVVRGCAKDIRDKYVQPPYTTNFGILFLPFEGLYAEVVNSGLVEQLQREYSISVAGPSTMAAILNALQMGFRTLAIQKHSHEAWVVLGSSPRGIRKICRHNRKGTEKPAGSRTAAGTSGRHPHPCHCPSAAGSGTLTAGGTAKVIKAIPHKVARRSLCGIAQDETNAAHSQQGNRRHFYVKTGSYSFEVSFSASVPFLETRLRRDCTDFRICHCRGLGVDLFSGEPVLPVVFSRITV